MCSTCLEFSGKEPESERPWFLKKISTLKREHRDLTAKKRQKLPEIEDYVARHKTIVQLMAKQEEDRDGMELIPVTLEWTDSKVDQAIDKIRLELTYHRKPPDFKVFSLRERDQVRFLPEYLSKVISPDKKFDEGIGQG